MQKDKGKLADLFKSAGYQKFERTGDIYALFYEFGFNVLALGGILTLITSSQWMKAGYGKSLRKLFLTRNPIKLAALGPGVFESATVDTNILIVKNEQKKNELSGIIVVNSEELKNLDKIRNYPMPYVDVEKWAILDNTEQTINHRINHKGKPLKDWDIKINFGIKTGYNQAFIIDEATKNDLVKTDSKSIDIIKPVLRGREIDKYFTEWDGGYIISTFPALKIDIENYSSVKKYLESFLPKLNQTGEKFINSIGEEESTRKLTVNKWFETQDPIGYYKELSKEKIIWKRIGSQLRFSYSDKEICCLDSTCICTGEKIKYLTALLNSKLCNYQLFENAPRTGMGDLIISVQALEPLMVYYPTNREQKIIENLFDKILYCKLRNQDTTLIESQIDNFVYKLYDLTYEEVKVIDPKFELSKIEYENLRLD